MLRRFPHEDTPDKRDHIAVRTVIVLDPVGRHQLVQAGGGCGWCGYASRRLRIQKVVASRAAASTTKMPVSMPWKAQNLLAGW